MFTVQDLLDLCEYCDHYIVIYDDNVIGDDAVDFGDELWSSKTGEIFPTEVGDLLVNSFELEENIFRIWANGEGIPNRYGTVNDRYGR